MATLLIFMVGFSIGSALGLFSFLVAWAVICTFAFAAVLSDGYLHSFIYAAESGLILTGGFVFGLIASYLSQRAPASPTGPDARRYRVFGRPQ